MPRSLQVTFAFVVAAVVLAGPWWYKREHDRHRRSFHVVEEGVLYRSGQLDLDGLKRLVHDYGIRTIISLRDGANATDQAEAEWAGQAFLKHVRIPPRPWYSSSDGRVPAEEGLEVFRQVMRDPANYPVLVHCFAGIHRTGACCAVYRMDFQGWSNRQALAEMRSLGYSTLDDDLDILTYLEHYQPRARQITAAP
jgi:protein tyrosine/serine phosphatase